MSWKTPSFIEINMSAEIGAYQEDDGGRGNAPPAVEPVPAPAPAAASSSPS
jgi:coenzyme PQQ precursor peptide PqqA